MHLSKLQVKNFRAIPERTVSFEDATGSVRPITVLAGPNGCGKTSLLLAVVQALRGALRARIRGIRPPGEDDIHRGEASGRDPVTAEVELDLRYETEELRAIRDVFEKTRSLREQLGKHKLSPPDLPDGRLRLQWQYPPRVMPDGTTAPPSDLLSDLKHGAVWLNGPSAAWRGWKSRLLSIEDMKHVGMMRVFPQVRDQQWGIDVEDSDESSDASDSAVDRSPTPPPTVAEALRRLGEWAHGQGIPEGDGRRNWESELQRRFYSICRPKEYKGYWLDHPRYGETPLLSDGGAEYPFQNAANGELVILQYLTQFTFPRPINNSLILIDEPELHLHPRWIRMLYRALPRMGDNNQFIMTTHSPELRQLAAEDNAVVDLGLLCEPVQTSP